MPWTKQEDEDQSKLQQGVEAQLKRGPTGPMPPFEKVNEMRKAHGMEPISQAQYNEEAERRNRARSSA